MAASDARAPSSMSAPPPRTGMSAPPGPMPEQAPAPPAETAAAGPSAGPPALVGGAGEWMAHVKRTMRANPGKKLKDVLKMAKKTYKKGTKKTARKTRKGSRKSKSWFMGGSSTIVPSAAGGPGSLTGSSRHRSRGRKH